MTDPLLISNDGQITAEWLTSILQTHGTLDSSGSVAGADVVSFGEAAGLMGSLFRATLSYSDGASGPASLVIKLPMDDPAQRGVADMLWFFQRECTFYAERASSTPYNTATIYGSAQDTETSDFVLVMEDLGHLDQIDQVAGASVQQMDAAVTAIAKQHAQYWQHDDLEALSNPFMRVDSDLYHAALPAVFAGAWDSAKVHGADILTNEAIAFGDRYGEHIPYMLSQLSEPATLVHGDFRGDNLLLDENGALSIVDFQITGVGAGVYDIGYFMAQSVDSDLRKANDERVVRLYCDTLKAEGVEVDIEATMTAYQMSFAFFLIYAVTSFQAWDAFDGRQHELMLKMLSRSVAAMGDNGSLSLLPALD
jgi:hypothetical protein